MLNISSYICAHLLFVNEEYISKYESEFNNSQAGHVQEYSHKFIRLNTHMSAAYR